MARYALLPGHRSTSPRSYFRDQTSSSLRSPPQARSRFRQKWGLSGRPAQDLLLPCLCWPCLVVQEAAQLQAMYRTYAVPFATKDLQRVARICPASAAMVRQPWEPRGPLHAAELRYRCSAGPGAGAAGFAGSSFGFGPAKAAPAGADAATAHRAWGAQAGEEAGSSPAGAQSFLHLGPAASASAAATTAAPPGYGAGTGTPWEAGLFSPPGPLVAQRNQQISPWKDPSEYVSADDNVQPAAQGGTTGRQMGTCPVQGPGAPAPAGMHAMASAGYGAEGAAAAAPDAPTAAPGVTSWPVISLTLAPEPGEAGTAAAAAAAGGQEAEHCITSSAAHPSTVPASSAQSSSETAAGSKATAASLSSAACAGITSSSHAQSLHAHHMHAHHHSSSSGYAGVQATSAAGHTAPATVITGSASGGAHSSLSPSPSPKGRFTTAMHALAGSWWGSRGTQGHAPQEHPCVTGWGSTGSPFADSPAAAALWAAAGSPAWQVSSNPLAQGAGPAASMAAFAGMPAMASMGSGGQQQGPGLGSQVKAWVTGTPLSWVDETAQAKEARAVLEQQWREMQQQQQLQQQHRQQQGLLPKSGSRGTGSPADGMPFPPCVPQPLDAAAHSTQGSSAGHGGHDQQGGSHGGALSMLQRLRGSSNSQSHAGHGLDGSGGPLGQGLGQAKAVCRLLHGGIRPSLRRLLPQQQSQVTMAGAGVGAGTASDASPSCDVNSQPLRSPKGSQASPDLASSGSAPAVLQLPVRGRYLVSAVPAAGSSQTQGYGAAELRPGPGGSSVSCSLRRSTHSHTSAASAHPVRSPRRITGSGAPVTSAPSAGVGGPATAARAAADAHTGMRARSCGQGTADGDRYGLPRGVSASGTGLLGSRSSEGERRMKPGHLQGQQQRYQVKFEVLEEPVLSGGKFLWASS